ncbi:MAG: MBL fold metallo-hydrolase [Acidilobus sp.]
MTVKRFSSWVEPLDRPANSYLVEVEGQTLLIDGGVEPPPSEVLNARFALLTHWHWDHVLGLARGGYKGAICASTLTLQYLRGSLPAFEGSAAVLKAFGEVPDNVRPFLEVSLARLREVLDYMRTAKLVELDSCEPVQTGIIKALQCPGHSDDHVCYVAGPHAFVGDAINPDSGLSIMSLEDYIKSLVRLLSDAGWEIAHPGHGRDVDRAYVAEWASENITGKIRRIVTFRSILSKEWTPLVSYLDALYGSKDPFVKWIGARSLLGYALSLARMGLAELNTSTQPWTIRARDQ